jgi:hypothetical protein
MLGNLTDPAAVRRAIGEYDELGRSAFLAKYGFGVARRYFIVYEGRQYDSKAIVGAAYGMQHPEGGPLGPADFSGGEATVVPVLERLGYGVVDRGSLQDAGALSRVLISICTQLEMREAGSAESSAEELSSLVRREAVEAVRSIVGSRGDVLGRTGIGTAADVPWVGIFPPDSEGSAQEGFYLVYLFAKDGSAVYLSLNQGTEQVRGGSEVLRKRALDLRRIVGAQPGLLTKIDLRSNNTRPKKYEAGSAYAVGYKRNEPLLPADAVADLLQMLDLLDTVTASGLHWDPEIESLHLVFKWNADVEPRTIDLHREVATREGSVWWGRFSKSPTPSIAKSSLERLEDQLTRGMVTHAYLYRRGMCWRTTVQEVRVDPPPINDPRFPSYYKPEDCNFFARLADFEILEPGWLVENAVLASHPDADPQRLAGALSNQTTPLFVYEFIVPEFGAVNPLPPPAETIDISNVTLADVCKDISTKIRGSGVDYGERHESLIRSAIVSLATKRLLLLTGLSGSGKTRLGMAIGQWFGPDRLRVVPVRPDWTGPDALLGFENGLSATIDGRHAWTVPETLEFILRASQDPENPYLLLLDEMNLAHVERYFADVLSGMESQSPVIPNLHLVGGEWRLREPTAVPFPENLFIAGTVNIDETTYMFSPKVLDRANTIEFRVLSTDLQTGAVAPDTVEAGDAALVRRFIHDSSVQDDDWGGRSQLGDWLRELHQVLAVYDREFGHRVFYEALRFGSLLSDAGDDSLDTALDLQVLQKVLPRFYGSVRQLADSLYSLGDWCFDGPGSAASPSFDPMNPPTGRSPVLPLSFDKVQRMTRRLRANHFVSFAE